MSKAINMPPPKAAVTAFIEAADAVKATPLIPEPTQENAVSEKAKPISLTLPAALLDAADKLAARKGLSRASLIKMLLSEAIISDGGR